MAMHRKFQVNRNENRNAYEPKSLLRYQHVFYEEPFHHLGKASNMLDDELSIFDKSPLHNMNETVRPFVSSESKMRNTHIALCSKYFPREFIW